MAVYKVHKTKDYTVMSNTHLKDSRMSMKAKGLLTLMLSLPETWDYSIAGLVAICRENETAVKNTLDELKKCGYLVVTKKTPRETESGRFEYQYDIYEKPFKKQEGKKQGVENLGVEILGVENQGQLSTNKSNIKELNINKYNNIIAYLNEKAGTSYKPTTKSTQQHINARLAEGYTEDDFKKVIDNKCTDWLGSEFEQYLRPATLFGPKFENYLNCKPNKKQKNSENTGSNSLKDFLEE